ncbi:lysozyme [Lysobacter capsici]|uniref:lysozyme n=1 Tax=Lysobacter capsici TaxID=435897 RepID=UPI000716788E|nr:lysozyme [Lysobacter capsici]
MKGRVAGVIAAGVLAIAAAFVAPWEGREHVPYRDIVGVLTVCDGHTGKDIEQRRYSDAECDRLLQGDLAVANAHVRRCITRAMPRNVEAALTSAAFNLGPAVVCGSTLSRLANAGDFAGACAQLSRWDYAGGRQVKGLTRRRAAERQLCEGRGTYAAH